MKTSETTNNKPGPNSKPRAHKIMYGISTVDNQFPSIKQLCSEQVPTHVYRTIHNQGPDIFTNYFEVFNHGKHIRRNQKGLKLPNVKSENGRNMYRFQRRFVI